MSVIMDVPVTSERSWSELIIKLVGSFVTCIALSMMWNIYSQLFLKNANEPPVVFHWVPIIGSTIDYGIDPFKFFQKCQSKVGISKYFYASTYDVDLSLQYGDIFTFILLGKKTTVYLGPKGNHFILNAKLKDANAEEIYAVLTTPVFGSDVIYDCPNSKLMEQKRFVKYGLSLEALESYVPLMEKEVYDFLGRAPVFAEASGVVDIPKTMAQITIFTAARSLQGQEIRKKLDNTYAELYHDLDDGFTPINFMLPWAPLPQNRRRDAAQKKMTQLYTDIIRARRANPGDGQKTDLLWTFMQSVYKDGTPVPEHECAHMMTGLLMAGQHSSSVTSAWTMLHLAAQPVIMEELYQEQLRTFSGNLKRNLQLSDIHRLPLHHNVVRETLRTNPPIHSIMRKAKTSIPIPDTDWAIPAGHVLLASPAAMGHNEKYFPEPARWDPHRWEKIANPEEAERDKVDYGFGPTPTGAASTYLPFGAGRHRCIGESFAYLQLTLIIAIMVREFRFGNVEGQVGVVETDYSSLFSRPKWPANVQYERRNKH